MNKKIDLSEYLIKNGTRLYNFCDVLLEKNVSGKARFLEKNDIYYNSFKQEKRLGKVSENNKTVSRLLEIFNYNFVTYELEEIENVLKDILDQAYIKNVDKNSMHLDFLNEYISKNDCLQPVYVLFRVILISFSKLEYNQSFIQIEKDLDYLTPFVKKKYFVDSLQFLLKCVLFYYEKYDDEIDIDNLSNKHNDYIWIYYEIRAGKGFIDKNYPIMQMNYEKALALYEKQFNFRRVLSVSNNFCYYYNRIGQYSSSIKYSEKLIFNPYIKELRELHSFVIMHYFISLLMLKDYKIIIKTYNKLYEGKSTINDLSYAIYALSEIIENKALINDFSSSNKYIEWIKEYKSKRSKKLLLSYANNDYEEKLVAMIILKIK